MIKPIPQKYVDPYENSTIRCAYHSDALGHSTEDCRTLKRKVEKMIQSKMIVVQNDDPPNFTQNQPLAPSDIHFIDTIRDGKKYNNSINSQEKTIEIGGASVMAKVQNSG